MFKQVCRLHEHERWKRAMLSLIFAFTNHVHRQVPPVTESSVDLRISKSRLDAFLPWQRDLALARDKNYSTL